MIYILSLCSAKKLMHAQKPAKHTRMVILALKFLKDRWSCIQIVYPGYKNKTSW